MAYAMSTEPLIKEVDMEHQRSSTAALLGAPLIFRQVAFPLAAFDYLKDFQRAYQGKYGVQLTNNQALALILGEHQRSAQKSNNGESEGHDTATGSTGTSRAAA